MGKYFCGIIGLAFSVLASSALAVSQFRAQCPLCHVAEEEHVERYQYADIKRGIADQMARAVIDCPAPRDEIRGVLEGAIEVVKLPSGKILIKTHKSRIKADLMGKGVPETQVTEILKHLPSNQRIEQVMRTEKVG